MIYSKAYSASKPVLVSDPNNENQPLIYSDGTLNGDGGLNMHPIGLIQRLKGLWGEEHIDLIRKIAKAKTEEERLFVLRENARTLKRLKGTAERFNTLLGLRGPAVPAKKSNMPVPGTAVRAPSLVSKPAKPKKRVTWNQNLAMVREYAKDDSIAPSVPAPSRRGLPIDLADIDDETLESDLREMRREKAATTIQAGFRGMKARQEADARRYQEYARNQADNAAADYDRLALGQARLEASKAGDDYDRFKPSYEEAKKMWMDSNPQTSGWNARMLKDLSKEYPNEVARDRRYQK
ncbi:MAG: IQ calmodulin-binding motif-containing protein [Alphaproteobacteria bacterium]